MRMLNYGEYGGTSIRWIALVIAVMTLSSCTEIEYSYDLDEYELDVPDGGIYLEDDGKPWRGEYDNRDQPADGYCGPTAVKNILWWYNGDIPWRTAAYELDTDEWDPGFDLWKYCAAACLGEVVVCANACYGIVSSNVEGTSIVNIIRVLKKRSPDGYTLKYTRENPSMIDEIIHQVSMQNPVLVTESVSKGTSHVSLVTGFEWKAGEIWTISANSPDRTLDEFMRGWSLIDSGKKSHRKVMYKFGMKPFTAVWYQASES